MLSKMNINKIKWYNRVRCDATIVDCGNSRFVIIIFIGATTLNRQWVYLLIWLSSRMNAKKFTTYDGSLKPVLHLKMSKPGL